MDLSLPYNLNPSAISSDEMENMFVCPKCRTTHPLDAFLSVNGAQFTRFCGSCRGIFSEQRDPKRPRENDFHGVRTGSWEDFLEYLSEL